MTPAEKEFLEALVRVYEEGGLSDLPFDQVMEACSGYRVLPFVADSDDGKMILSALGPVMQKAMENMAAYGFRQGRRVNERGNDTEDYLKDALLTARPLIHVQRPTTPNGHTRSAGYPDILCQIDGISFYLECKIYEKGSEDSTLRTFYLQPARRGEFKVDRDAYHLLAAFAFENQGGKATPVSWRLLSLHDLKVKLKPEFNASNRDMYQTDLTVLQG